MGVPNGHSWRDAVHVSPVSRGMGLGQAEFVSLPLAVLLEAIEPAQCGVRGQGIPWDLVGGVALGRCFREAWS